MSQIAVGQRWLSETEAELGLGIVQNIENRLVTVFFPACEEERTYAMNNAPLLRIQFTAGDSIETSDGQCLEVSSVEVMQGLNIYSAFPPNDKNNIQPVPETQLSHQLRINQAADRLFSKQIDSPRWFQLRHAALSAREHTQRSEVQGLVGPRTNLIPHQLYIAHEVANRHAPRVLLADEVGLGKTIEAGLIIHQQLLTHRAQRVLIIVPQPLVHQWFVELIRRFNLHFSIFDQERVNALIESGEENPFLTEQLVLCSLDFLQSCNINQLIEAKWDLLIIDEAHHLEWSESSPSEEYQRVESIAQQTPGLLLLTATPEQLGAESHFARLRLLDPDRFHSLNAFIDDQSNYQPIAEIASQIHDLDEWDQALIEKIQGYVKDINIVPENRQSILEELLDRHGTSRVLFRNTRKNIAGFPTRFVHGYPQTSSYEPNHDDDVNTLLHPETAYGDASWCEIDSRIVWLKGFLKQHRKDKTLIICANKNTAIDLEIFCRFKLGLNTSVFHEDMDIISRDRAAAYFADMENGAQTLICSEIGSEGRNFQFSHHLVLMDLPLNPDLLEQRIGRLDRIGQQEDIQIHVPYFANHAQEVMFHWYHEGMDAFRHTNPAGTLIHLESESYLTEALRQPEDEALVEELIKKTQEITTTLKTQMATGRDKLLELSSFNTEIADKLVDQITDEDDQTPQYFMENVFTHFGISAEDHSLFCSIIKPSNHMYTASFPHLPEEGITVTYDREIALTRDDMQFLSWEHPMVTGAIELVLSQEKGNACVCILKNKAIPAGTILVEALYNLESIAPKHLQAQRFLPSKVIRNLVDKNGRNLADAVPHDGLSKQCQKLEKHIARQVLSSEENILRDIIESSQTLAEEQASTIIATALDDMKASQTHELDRLLSLKEKNPSIRDEEIEFIKLQTEHLLLHISETLPQLDAVRVIIAT